MEPIRNEGGQFLSSLFSFSFWKEETKSPRARQIELALFFGIGIILGIMIKSATLDSFTIGYEDYTIAKVSDRVDLNQVEKNVLSRNDSPFGSKKETANSCLSQ